MADNQHPKKSTSAPPWVDYSPRYKPFDRHNNQWLVQTSLVKMAVLWIAAPCRLLQDGCLHHQGDASSADGGSTDLLDVSKHASIHNATTQRAAIFVLTAVRTSRHTKSH
jgi:hypothetical protein